MKLPNKRTRFKLAIISQLFLAAITVTAMSIKMETVATTCIAGILTITTMYIGSEGYRASIKEP